MINPKNSFRFLGVGSWMLPLLEKLGDKAFVLGMRLVELRHNEVISVIILSFENPLDVVRVKGVAPSAQPLTLVSRETRDNKRRVYKIRGEKRL